MTRSAKDFSRLFFGRDDAENDLADGLLGAGFLRTPAYEDALSGRKMLIIGRKGSGKSAICMRLTTDGAYPGPTALITPDDAAGEEIRRFELQGLAGDTAKSLIWRYAFAVQAARHLDRHARRGHGRWLPGGTPASVKALHRFLRENQEADEERLYDRLVKGRLGLQGSLSLEMFPFKASVDVAGSSEGARADRQLKILERGVAAAFADLDCQARGHAPLLLLVDQVEQVWSLDPDSNSMVIGLLLASKHVMHAYRKAVRCVLFLRSDIYDTLNFTNADKFHGDEKRLNWTRQALRDIALARAVASLGRPVDARELWEAIFPPTVDGTPVEDFLFSRALPRPRDAIQFLNLCRETAVDSGHDRVHEEDVLRATLQFSRWKLQDLGNEYLVTHPFLGRLFTMFTNSGYVVMRSALEARFELHRDNLQQQFPAYAGALTPEGVIDALYGVSFLGVKRGNDVVYAGGAEDPVQPYENEFHIHPCFRPALNAVGPLELHPYQPRFIDHRFAQSTALSYGIAPDSAYPQDPAFVLAEALVTSCERILRQMTRAALPVGTEEEISRQVVRVMNGASEVRLRLDYGGHVDVAEHVASAAQYLGRLAAQLTAHGVGNEGGGLDVVRRIETESRSLIRTVGGAAGGIGEGQPVA